MTLLRVPTRDRVGAKILFILLMRDFDTYARGLFNDRMFTCHAHWWEDWQTDAMMSEYTQALDPAARDRYSEKLRILGIAEQDDPYASWNEGNFVDDLSVLPPVEYGHIFCYFVERPGVYLYSTGTHAMEELRRIQLLRERVRTRGEGVDDQQVQLCPANPSQRAPDKAHHAVKGDGQIITDQQVQLCPARTSESVSVLQIKPTMHGLLLKETARSLLLTAPAWLGKA